MQTCLSHQHAPLLISVNDATSQGMKCPWIKHLS